MSANHSDAEIYDTLEHILAYEMFATSPRARDFLKYIVTETLAGRSKTLSGTTIGQDVFEKGEDFDPIQDSVVRVYARRLRFMLRDYYLDYPARDSIIITIPKGGYKPSFEKNLSFYNSNIPTPPEQRRVDLTTIIIAASCVLVILTGLFLWTPRFWESATIAPDWAETVEFNQPTSSYPMIAVAPFKNKTGLKDYDFLEEGLQKKMVEDLSRFSLIRPLVYEESYETLLKQQNAPFDYVFSAIILSVKPELDLYIKLVDTKDPTSLFERRIRRSNDNSDYFDSLSEIVSELSGNFAGLEGAIVEKRLQNIEEQIDNDTFRILNLEAFECFGLVGKLLENPRPKLYKKVYTCLDVLLEEDRSNTTLLSAFGWVTYIGAISHEPVLQAKLVNPDIKAEDGIKMMTRAVEIDPYDAWAQQTLSAYKSMIGDTQGALKHAEMAVIANPGDPDNLTSLSMHLTGVGQWDRALALAQEALDRNPNPSADYYYTFFNWALNTDNAAAMQEAAEQIAKRDDYYKVIYSYLAAVALKDETKIAALQPDINAIAARNNNNIMAVIGVILKSEALQSKAYALFIKGGTLLPDTAEASNVND